ENGATPAHTLSATEPSALELEVIAQDVDERGIRSRCDGAPYAVDVELDGRRQGLKLPAGLAGNRRRRTRRTQHRKGQTRSTMNPANWPGQPRHPNFSGSWRGPRTEPSDQVTAPVRWNSGIRLRTSSTATVISMRARFEPTQRWMPRPNAACRFSLRSIITLSASGNISGSRLAAGNDKSTISPGLNVQPLICVSFTTSRAIVTGA